MNASRSPLFHGYVYVEVYLMLSFDAVSAAWICTHHMGFCLDSSLSSRQPGGSGLCHVTCSSLLDLDKAHPIA